MFASLYSLHIWSTNYRKLPLLVVILKVIITCVTFRVPSTIMNACNVSSLPFFKSITMPHPTLECYVLARNPIRLPLRKGNFESLNSIQPHCASIVTPWVFDQAFRTFGLFYLTCSLLTFFLPTILDEFIFDQVLKGIFSKCKPTLACCLRHLPRICICLSMLAWDNMESKPMNMRNGNIISMQKETSAEKESLNLTHQNLFFYLYRKSGRK